MTINTTSNELFETQLEYLKEIKKIILNHRLDPYFDSGNRKRAYFGWESIIRNHLIEVIDRTDSKVELTKRMILYKREVKLLRERLALLGGDD